MKSEPPVGKQYDVIRDELQAMIDDVDTIPYEEVSITSFDGLKLVARMYINDMTKPVEIMFHGYKGTGSRDFSGGLKMVLERGMNAIVVTERGHGISEGKCLSFGINERRDVLSWVNFAIEKFGSDVKIILCGISMGGATVMMASNLDLPKNVLGIVEDCGYTSPKEIIKRTMNKMHYPSKILYPFTRLGGMIYGGFDLNSSSAIKSIKECKLPVYFIHGMDDRFVPFEMGERLYNECNTKKWFHKVENAGHGLSFILDREGYDKLFDEFLEYVLK